MSNSGVIEDIYMDIKWEELENFIFPLMENVCKPRGLKAIDVKTLFDAYCPKCERTLNPEALAIQAPLSQIGQATKKCPNCEHEKLRAVFKLLKEEEIQALSNDRFFSQLSAMKQWKHQTEGRTTKK
jgi:hypothetical protein